MHSLQAGSLNRRITLQQPSSAQDSYGQPTSSWTDVLDCWASIRASSSKEVYAVSGFVTQLSHIIMIRHPRTSIDSTMRVQYGQRSFQIRAVSDPDESKVQLNLLCLEINGGQ